MGSLLDRAKRSAIRAYMGRPPCSGGGSHECECRRPRTFRAARHPPYLPPRGLSIRRTAGTSGGRFRQPRDTPMSLFQNRNSDLRRRTCPQKLEVLPPRSVPAKLSPGSTIKFPSIACGPRTIELFSSSVRLLLTISSFSSKIHNFRLSLDIDEMG